MIFAKLLVHVIHINTVIDWRELQVWNDFNQSRVILSPFKSFFLIYNK